MIVLLDSIETFKLLSLIDRKNKDSVGAMGSYLLCLHTPLTDTSGTFFSAHVCKVTFNANLLGTLGKE